MQITFLTQLDWLIRLILAGVCGYAIGYERNSRSKNAGTRTHLIVALSAALMIMSQNMVLWTSSVPMESILILPELRLKL